MARFTEAGYKHGKIIEAIPCMNPYGEDDGNLYIGLHIEDDNGEHDEWWYGELSSNYVAQTGKTAAELTMSSLMAIGWENGHDFSDASLASLVGVELDFTVKEKVTKKGNTIYTIAYIGGGFGPKKLSAEDAAARVAALFGTDAAKGTAPEKPTRNSNADYQGAGPADTEEDPFAAF